MRIYDAEQVEHLLDMAGCIGAVRDAMARLSAADFEQPLRQIVPIRPGDLFALMPGSLVSPDGFGAKVITAFADKANPQRSKHRGIVVLFDRESGEPKCVADAGAITEIRTAAATAVATDALARKDATTLAVFGTGSQARSHLQALPLVRQLSEVLIWGRSEASAQAMIDAMQPEVGVPLRYVADAREAASADILCTVTSSREPVVLGEWVRPGAHVNIVGSSFAGPVEVDSALVVMSRYFADSRRSVLAAGAEYLVARDAGLIDESHILGEIGEVVSETVEGRRSPEEVTLYKSLGHIVQDLASAAYVDAKATAQSA